jgi:GNAT superfamily N-acetyltransferase
MDFSCITGDDEEEIIALTLKHLTDGSYVENCMRRQFSSGKYLGVKATENGELAGYLTFKEGIDFTYPHPELAEEAKKEAKGRKVFTGDAIYVNPKYRNRGLGGKLTAMARDIMLENGGYYFLGEMWIYPDGMIPAYSPSKIYGEYEYEKKVPMFYKDNKKYGLTCPICGEECKCGALISLIRLVPGKGTEDENK